LVSQFFDEAASILLWNIPRGKNAVDEDPQLDIRELSIPQVCASSILLVGADVPAQLAEQREVPPHRVARRAQAVVGLELFDDLPRREGVLLVGIVL